MVGLSSGFVNFYNEDGHQLRSQRFYDEPVGMIRAQSGRNVEELVTIHYRKCVAIIHGSQLFPLLRAGQKQGRDNHASETDSKIPCQKWMYDGHCGEIMDSVVIGAQKGCAFDHLLNTCLEDGFNAQYKAIRTQTSLVLTTGTRPFVGFQYAKEGFNATELADAAKAVARYLKSALPSWLSSKSAVEPPKSPPPPVMTCQFGICDSQRNAYSVWVSPNKALAAVSDNLGRIAVVDCSRATAVRMFKGYREAQCGFLEVKNDAKGSAKQKTGKLRATFLVIYAPLKGILEVWPMQKGDRVAAFSAPRNGQLLYTLHSLMGVSSTSKVKFKGSPCVFFDPSEETFKEIVIPFHLALSGSNSEIAKDMHLLKRLKQIIRSGDLDVAAAVDILQELVKQIKSLDFKLECLELAATAKKSCSEILMAVVTAFPSDGMPAELKVLCANYTKLVNFYTYICKVEPTTEEPANKIQLNDMELLNIQKLIDLSTLTDDGSREQRTPKVTFDERGMKDNKFLTFLSVFAVDKMDSITLKSQKPETISLVGEVIYKCFLELNHPLGDFAKNCVENSIESETLVRLLLSYWLARPFEYTKFEELILDLTRFTAILGEICAVANQSQTATDYNSISPWWQNVRELLLENPNTMRSLLAALMCRNMCLRSKGVAGDGGDGDTELEDGFENMSQEACQWNLLIGKLDDISVLGAILNNQMRVEAETYPKLRQEIPKISLRLILAGGRGVISELVAKWLTNTGIDPHLLLEAIEPPKEQVAGPSKSGNSNLKDYQLSSQDLLANADKPLKESTDTKLEPILHGLQIMRGNFPFSLESSKLLANMGWEYLCFWSKNLAELECLDAGIKCLDLIRNTAIRHAMCTMVWKAHLRIPLEATKKLIFKAGKLPKEKLCLQDVGLSDAVMPEFVDKCERFLKVYLDSCTLDIVVVKYEEFLKAGPQPLIEVALKSRPGVREVIEVHLEMLQVLHLVAHFNFKFSKQLSGLFDQTGNQLMFGDMGAMPQDAIVVTDHIRRYRLEFLNRVITAAMELIRWDGETVFMDDYNLWMRRISMLADVWAVDRVKMAVHTVRVER